MSRRSHNHGIWGMIKTMTIGSLICLIVHVELHQPKIKEATAITVLPSQKSRVSALIPWLSGLITKSPPIWVVIKLPDASFPRHLWFPQWSYRIYSNIYNDFWCYRWRFQGHVQDNHDCSLRNGTCMAHSSRAWIHLELGPSYIYIHHQLSSHNW